MRRAAWKEMKLSRVSRRRRMNIKMEDLVQNTKGYHPLDKPITRRGFLKGAMAGVCFSVFNPEGSPSAGASGETNPLFWVRQMPNQPFTDEDNGNYHFGITRLLP